MSRNPRNNDQNVINYPSIVDIQVIHKETSVNFKKQAPKKIFQRQGSKEKEEENGSDKPTGNQLNGNEEQQVDEAAAAAAAPPVKKDKK